MGFLRNGGSADYVALEEYAKAKPGDGVGILAGCAAGEVAPGVVDGLLGGLAEAVKSGAQLYWPLVLRSLRQIVRQMVALEAPSAAVLVEYRRAVDYGARLIRQGCVSDAIPTEYAHELWNALDDVTTLDTVWSDPSRDHVADLDGLLSAGLNHASGTITRAVIGAETRSLRALQRLEWRADLLSMYATHFGEARRLNRDLRRLRRVTAEEARAWSRDYLHPGNRVVVRYSPEAPS